MSALAPMLRAGVDDALAYLRKADPEAAADLDQLRRADTGLPRIVVVGETKRGKSSLVNMLLGVPGLAPVDAAVATASYLEFSYADRPEARAYLPGLEEPVAVDVTQLGDWATAAGQPPDGQRPPRRVEVRYPAPLLRELSLVDTPGTGGLDPLHAELALDAAARATALLFVVDPGAPFAEPELTFLVEASKRVNFVVFALAKIDAYPGWRTILADNRDLLRAHAPRFGAAPWYPVSARLAELAATLGAGPAEGAGAGGAGTVADAGAELLRESRVGDLRDALLGLAAAGQDVRQANLLRAVRGELVRLDQRFGDRIRATDPDPAEAARVRRDRAAVAARQRGESRQWSLLLTTETQRAQVEVTATLRTEVARLRESLLERVDAVRGEDLKGLAGEVDAALHVLSVRLSEDLEARFAAVGERVLAQVFDADEVHHVVRQLNARLRHTLDTRPPRDGAAVGADHALVALSSAGMAMMAGRGAAAGASALGLGSAAGVGLAIPVVGVGLGLAAGAYMLWRRKHATDRQQARGWLRDVLAEAAAALTDEITHRFTDLRYAMTLALDEAIERRLRQLDDQLAAIDQAMADDKAERARRRAALTRDRETLRASVARVDETLVRVRQLAPAGTTEGQE